MLEKWKQRAVKMNFLRAVIIFVITGFVLAVGSSAAVYSNFQGRISRWEQLVERDREYGRKEKEYDEEHISDSKDREHDGDFKEEKEKDLEDVLKKMYLSGGDIALMAGCCIIGMGIGVWYWALVLIAVYRKAYRMGVNAPLWMLAALIFNLAALAALYLYATLRGTCRNCGRVKSGSGKFCDRCGNLLKKECPQCGQAADISSVYCSNCGKKLVEKEG